VYNCKNLFVAFVTVENQVSNELTNVHFELSKLHVLWTVTSVACVTSIAFLSFHLIFTVKILYIITFSYVLGKVLVFLNCYIWYNPLQFERAVGPWRPRAAGPAHRILQNPSPSIYCVYRSKYSGRRFRPPSRAIR
jgi:predicted membrane metal-binding protein